MRVTWSVDALADVEKHRQQLAAWSELAGRRFLARLDAAIIRLERFPASGRVVAEFGEPGFREVVVAPYRLLYLLDESDVHIVAVVHGAMDLTGDSLPDSDG